MITLNEYLRKYKNITLPISGGWGFDQESACVIDVTVPSDSPVLPHDVVPLEYVLIKEIIHFDLIVSRGEDASYAGIEWSLLEQELIHSGDRKFDRLRFEVTAYPARALALLLEEIEGPDGRASPSFNEQDAIARLNALKWTGRRDFWFDITSKFL